MCGFSLVCLYLYFCWFVCLFDPLFLWFCLFVSGCFCKRLLESFRVRVFVFVFVCSCVCVCVYVCLFV